MPALYVPKVPRALAAHLGRRIGWQLCARTGITTAQAASLLDEVRPADVAVVITGVNDVLDQVPPGRAIGARQALLATLRERAGVRHVVWTPVPPMDKFEGLPQPLRWVLGQDAAAHEQALRDWARLEAGISHLPFELPVDDTTLLASDGFHPSAGLYATWADALATHIAEAVWPRL